MSNKDKGVDSKDPSWSELTAEFSGKFHTEPTMLISAGRMQFGRNSFVRVVVAGHPAGLVISRYPLKFLWRKIFLPWEAIIRIVEFNSLISANRPEQTEVEIHLDNENCKKMVLPWNHGLNEYLVRSSAYEDRRPKLRVR